MAVKVNYESWWREWQRDLGVILSVKFEISLYLIISQCADDKLRGLNKTSIFVF